MFQLDGDIRRWREGLMRRSSLSPRELDELEDHLRARADLEMELNATLTPAQAFAIARNELGEGVALSREFAKAGQPRWRRWLSVGLAMFGVSFFLPVAEVFPGWEALLWALDHAGNPVELLSPLSNGPVLATLLLLRYTHPSRGRWLTWLMTGATTLNLYWAIVFALDGLHPLVELGIGYWTWVGSFGCLAAAVWLRDREWAPAKVREVVA